MEAETHGIILDSRGPEFKFPLPSLVNKMDKTGKLTLDSL